MNEIITALVSLFTAAALRFEKKLAKLTGKDRSAIRRYLTEISPETMEAHGAISKVGGFFLMPDVEVQDPRWFNICWDFDFNGPEQDVLLRSIEQLGLGVAEFARVEILRLRASALAVAHLGYDPLEIARNDLREGLVRQCVSSKVPAPETLRFLEAKILDDREASRAAQKAAGTPSPAIVAAMAAITKELTLQAGEAAAKGEHPRMAKRRVFTQRNEGARQVIEALRDSGPVLKFLAHYQDPAPLADLLLAVNNGKLPV